MPREHAVAGRGVLDLALREQRHLLRDLLHPFVVHHLVDEDPRIGAVAPHRRLLRATRDVQDRMRLLQREPMVPNIRMQLEVRHNAAATVDLGDLGALREDVLPALQRSSCERSFSKPAVPRLPPPTALSALSTNTTI